MAKPTKTQPTPDPIPPEAPPDAVQLPERPDYVLRRHAETVANLTFDTLMRALDAGVDIKMAMGPVSIEAFQGRVISGVPDGAVQMDTTPLEFAAQAGLLMAAAQASQAVGCRGGADAS